MIIVKIDKLPNGAHQNQTWNTGIVPDGYAMIPDGMEIDNFPFGDIEVAEIEGVMTVTKWTALPIPEVEPAKPQPTELDKIQAQVTYTAMKTNTLIPGGVK